MRGLSKGEYDCDLMGHLNLCSTLASNMVKKSLQIDYCAVSKVKVETVFLQKIQHWSDNFHYFD